MTTLAGIGYGTLFQKRTSTGPDVWTTYGEQTQFSGPSMARDAVEATHSESPNRRREFIPGLIDEGEISFETNMVPGAAALVAQRGEFSIHTSGRYRLLFVNGDYLYFDGFATGLEADMPLDDKMTLPLTYKITGETVYVDAAVPVNSVLPAISGIAQVGQTLTAYPGNWTSGVLTYVWKNEGVAIGGATASTYVPVAGDVGDNITVTVTATNSAGAASATSAETLPVIAA